jgi:hypothetical protein
MIADALRLEIERYAVRMRRTNPLYSRAADGTLTVEHLTRYLTAIHSLVAHTPLHLQRAYVRASAAGDDALANHYRSKLGEEAGHDEWAARDLAAMHAGREPRSQVVHPHMRSLIAFIEEVIERDPTLYLAYILFAEYLTVLLGGDWIELLESRCGIPKTWMSVIGNHAELDKEHVGEAFVVIDDLVGDPRKLVSMREVLTGAMARFDSFCRGILEEADGALGALPARAPAA